MAVPPPSPPAKAALRRDLRARRAAFFAGLDVSARAGAAAAIERHLGPLLSRTGPIAGYVAHRGEADVLPFLLKAFHLGHEIALPHVAEGSDSIRFTRWQPDMAMQGGLAGIPQPDAIHPKVAPAIVLAPLVGFDRGGRRLGQGGGFYDRWFLRHPQVLRIGIAWSVQEEADIPADPWDMPLHAIVTEKEWIAP
jgi:5-formyltetrahydrofolate cyclo-ligase